MDMTEPTDNAAEVQPLKGGEGSAAPPVKKGLGCHGGQGLSKMSRWRTAAFFLSLFICLTVVFAFSFIIPCPIRPAYQRNWNRTYPESTTYEFLAVEDVNQDKVLDIIFVLKASVGSLNTSCTNQSVPCLFVTAVTGTNGDALWEHSLAPEFHWAQCGVQGLGGASAGCLLSHGNQLTAIEKNSGTILWQQLHPPILKSELPVLTVPDLDGDGVEDIALVGSGQTQAEVVMLSAKTGSPIGAAEVLHSAQASRHLLHATAAGSQYVLFQTGSGLYGKALWRIVDQAKPGSEVRLKRDRAWETKTNDTSGLVLLYRSDSIQQVVRVAKQRSGQNLLLVTEGAVELIDGDSLLSLWRVNTSRVLSEPAVGHYNKDGDPDVVLEEDHGNGTKRVMILDGKSGGLLWEVSLLVQPDTPKPASFHTIHTFSIFMFWGHIQTNDSSSTSRGRFSYLLHPLHPMALLEKSSITDHIIAFKSTLLERGRHACYIMLTGPEREGPEGTVTLTKRKLKEDLPESRVSWLTMNRDEGDDQIKEAFNKVRFSQDT